MNDLDIASSANLAAVAGLRGRSFLKELDQTVEEWHGLIALATLLKYERRNGSERQQLRGRNLVLIFEKTSTRTRCAFEVAAYDQGARVTYLDPSGSQLGHKESIADTARVLGRMYDGIEYRGSRQERVASLAAYAGVPVWNGLTDQWHPTQSLCDIMTMLESSGKDPTDISFAYVGDARNNVANSLAVAGAMMGMDVRMVAPMDLWTEPHVWKAAQRVASDTGARMTLTQDIDDGLAGVDFVYTDVWLSMGEPAAKWTERIRLLAPYSVTADLLDRTRNPRVRFMHCLPAFHDLNTRIGKEIFDTTGRSFLEVSEDVFESPHSIVFDQAENRLHTAKAVMVATLGG